MKGAFYVILYNTGFVLIDLDVNIDPIVLEQSVPTVGNFSVRSTVFGTVPFTSGSTFNVGLLTVGSATGIVTVSS